ncbi:MAG: DksA/TraR family C4-type zinc finger protein [Wenzhouxiangellaceae bacterium]|nr:DksA/TraR family C4-type zinc finger protein [Wenzhouxiangellaceae bacterium]
MAGGWARDGAVQDQIDASVDDEVRRARSRLAGGPARRDCLDCGDPIPEARRKAVPGVLRCVACQQEHDAERGGGAAINRRGSKDSQLR